MRFSVKAISVCALVGFVLGFLLGFVPQYRKNATLAQEYSALRQGKKSLQDELATTQSHLMMRTLAVRAAVVYTESEKHNYSVALEHASSLFTDLRTYADRCPNQDQKQQLEEVLGVRDQVISGLAKADPAVAQQLQDVFLKLISNILDKQD